MAPEQLLLSACASCPLLAPQKGIAAQMAPGVLSICKRSALAHLIPLSTSVTLMWVPFVPAHLSGTTPHSGAAPSSGASHPG